MDVLFWDRFGEGGAFDLDDLLEFYHQRFLLLAVFFPEHAEMPEFGGLEQALDVFGFEFDDDVLDFEAVHVVHWFGLSAGGGTSRF